MAKFLLQNMSVVVLVISPTMVCCAQVFNPPATQPNVAAQQSAVPQLGVQQAGGPVGAAQSGAVEQTGWSGIPMPKLTMPKLTLPKVTLPSMASVTAPMKAGFGKVTSGTKKAWEGTKEILSFGQKKSSPTLSRTTPAQQKTSFWQRLIAKPAPPTPPQTVGEFMSQPRLNP